VKILMIEGERDRVLIVKRAVHTGALEAGVERASDDAEERLDSPDRLALFTTVLGASRDAFLILDDDARCIDANAAALAVFGLTRATLSVSGFCAIDPAATASADEREALWASFKSGCDERLRREVTIVSQGKRWFLEMTGGANFLPHRHYLQFRDITERRRAEASRARLDALVESSGQGIASADFDGTLKYWGSGAAHLYNYTEREILGLNEGILVPPEFAARVAAAYQHIRDGARHHSFETTRRRKDASTFPALLSLSRVFHDDELVGIRTITRDLTTEKILEARLLAADRMAAVGVIAASVAHEINNPLTAVLSNIEFFASRQDSERCGPDVDEALQHSRIAIGRILDIVSDIRAFARPVDEQRSPTNLAEVLDAAARMAMSQVGRRARVVREYATVPNVEASASRLEQVFLNLIVNAAQSFSDASSDANAIRLRLSVEGARVVAQVTDTGAGIAPENVSRVFEPFFTTKSSGTGLGLAISQRLIRDLGGDLTVESVVGVGTTFRVTLPAVVDISAVTPEAETGAAAPTCAKRGRLLVIDDEPFISAAIARALRREHDVKGVTSAGDALALFDAGERFDLVLCDLSMPSMSGIQFYSHVALHYPDLASRITFFTGGASTPEGREFMSTRKNITLDKPFTNEQLRTFIKALMRPA
jgi:PAS domain S-box-containing protein